MNILKRFGRWLVGTPAEGDDYEGSYHYRLREAQADAARYERITENWRDATDGERAWASYHRVALRHGKDQG